MNTLCHQTVFRLLEFKSEKNVQASGWLCHGCSK